MAIELQERKKVIYFRVDLSEGLADQEPETQNDDDDNPYPTDGLQIPTIVINPGAKPNELEHDSLQIAEEITNIDKSLEETNYSSFQAVEPLPSLLI